MTPVIITCAVTGAAHTPSMSPHLPVTPEEIAEQSIAAAAAGASIIHLHARDPQSGKPTGDTEVFHRFLQRIKGESDAVINISTGGGGPGVPVPERARAARELRPEMASLNMGSINLNLSELALRDREWKHDWEKPFLQATSGVVFQNTFDDIEWIMDEVGAKGGTRFEYECYDIGHLYSLAYFLDRGLIKAPLFIQSVFGLRGGIGAHPEDLMQMKRTADRLFGDAYRWSVMAAGVHQMRIATMAALMGANVRVGLEDSLYISRGELAVTNAQQVGKIRRILEELGMQVATPAEAREMLGLKGVGEVGF
jgi:uncharacterized protein (DUF849 family)